MRQMRGHKLSGAYVRRAARFEICVRACARDSYTIRTDAVTFDIFTGYASSITPTVCCAYRDTCKRNFGREIFEERKFRIGEYICSN